MCEMLAVKSKHPIAIEQVLKYAMMLEQYGVAGYSWGVVWTTADGELKRYRNTDGIQRDSLFASALSGVVSTTYLVHLRRPSLLTSIAHKNAQPYLNEDHTIAFAHNGFFQNHSQHRTSFSSQLEGTSDSEVGFRLYLSLLADHHSTQALAETHSALGGKANIGVIRQGGEMLIYAGNTDNHVFVFEMDGMRLATTSLHSDDDFVFQTIFPKAAEIEQIPLLTAKAIEW